MSIISPGRSLYRAACSTKMTHPYLVAELGCCLVNETCPWVFTPVPQWPSYMHVPTPRCAYHAPSSSPSTPLLLQMGRSARNSYPVFKTYTRFSSDAKPAPPAHYSVSRQWAPNSQSSDPEKALDEDWVPVMFTTGAGVTAALPGIMICADKMLLFKVSKAWPKLPPNLLTLQRPQL